MLLDRVVGDIIAYWGARLVKNLESKFVMGPEGRQNANRVEVKRAALDVPRDWVSEVQARLILGVDADADMQELKRAFRSKCKKLHPDVSKSNEAHTEFIVLKSAFELLKNKIASDRV